MMKWIVLAAVAAISFEHVASLNPFDFVDVHNQLDEATLKGVLAAKEVVGTPMKDEEVTYYLFKKGQTNYTQFYFEDPSIAANTEGRIYFLIHGWGESRQKQWYADLTAALLNRDPTSHVIQVDWSQPASTKNYGFAVYNTEDVGRLIANLIRKLTKRHGQKLEDVVVIGHSLGGQISGFAGKGFKTLTSRKQRLPRIIALDPAGPIYTNRPEEKRLNKEDADNVIVIHTDGGVLGMMSSCGSLDFFPNSGALQPGCFDLTCSHWRSWTFFIEAVNDLTQYEALRCSSWSTFKRGGCGDPVVKETMGNALFTTKSGNFYLRTKAKAPFSEPLETGPKSIFPKFGLGL